MRRTNFYLFLLSATLLTLSANAQPQSRNFIPVEGASLAAKMETATRQGMAGTSPLQSRFWTAYSFDVRPGIAVDFEWVGDDGSRSSFSGSNITVTDSIAVSIGSNVETRNLGIFLLRTRETGDVVRVETYNLDRQREYSSYPVYWLGRAANEESLNLLRGLAQSLPSDRLTSDRSSGVAESATRAIALHDDRRVGEILEALARSNLSVNVRAQAISWLGRTPGTTPARQAYLSELARNERESTEIRRSAIRAFGKAKDAATLNTLQALYATTEQEGLKRSVLSSVADNDSRDAISFLVKVARTDADPKMRRRALNYLGNKAGEQSLAGLTGTIEQRDAETEIQKQAVVALSRRPAAESVPMLLNVARTHRKPEVRREALLVLARTGDDRALDLFREILLK